MKRDFSRELIGLGEQKLVDAEGAPLTLSGVVTTALLGTYPDEQATGEEKFRRYQLAARIDNAGIQEVAAEEVALIKRLIGKGYPPIVVGPAYQALEQDPAPEPITA
jgi:hypothetical protein